MEEPNGGFPEKTNPDVEDPETTASAWPAKADPDDDPERQKTRLGEEKLMRAEAVARRLDISVSQVYALHAAGKLVGYRITTKNQGGLRFSREHVARMLRDAEQGGNDGPDCPPKVEGGSS